METHEAPPLLDGSSTSNATGIAQERAKRPEAIVAGPYGHPIHPTLVTIPIGAWVTSFAFDVRSLLGSHPRDDARASRDAMAVGLAGGLAAAAIGYLDWRRLTPGTKAFAYGSLHAVLNVGAMMFYVTAWRRRSDLVAADIAATANAVGDGARAGVTVRDLAAHAAALGLLTVSGFLGGELAYRYGVRVADEATQRHGHMVSD